MNCLPTSKCTEREFDTTKYIVSNCNVIEVTLTQKQNTDCTTEFVSLLDASGNSYPETSEFVSVNNQISRVIIDGLSTCVADAMGGIPTVQDCNGNDAVPVYDPCAVTAINTAKDAIVAAINGRPDYTAQLTSIGDTLTAMKADTATISTGIASSLVLLQAIVDKPDPTPIDLQPVLDKLDELIALDTTENSTLVDVKNQLIAANVTLSNAETLLTHIDTDMHEVVTKLQSALDLLTFLQELLTTIDGRIVAVQNAIATADANNVAALNDIKTELQAVNINTDTLEALITAGNVLLTSITANTDEIEPKLDSLITLITPTQKVINSGSLYIGSGTGATNYGASFNTFTTPAHAQSVSIVVVQAGINATVGDSITLVTTDGVSSLYSGMNATYSVAQGTSTRTEELAPITFACVGNAAAFIVYTY